MTTTTSVIAITTIQATTAPAMIAMLLLGVGGTNGSEEAMMGGVVGVVVPVEVKGVSVVPVGVSVMPVEGEGVVVSGGCEVVVVSGLLAKNKQAIEWKRGFVMIAIILHH